MPEADDWARAEATPSGAEITRIRRLIQRVSEDNATLTEPTAPRSREPSPPSGRCGTTS
ncbi:hypothetical protein WKI65_32565 [Streptomyces sp. MS1.AVA.3]|uniref:hypothetical protein n=1 Tax=Streptomyces decoyicus TaxID=249567 RepID=UPI0030C5B376